MIYTYDAIFNLVVCRGGGNQENLEMNYGAEPLIWMMDEARKAGLNLKPHNKEVGTYSEVTESLTGVWWLLEYFPLLRVSQQQEEKDITSRQVSFHTIGVFLTVLKGCRIVERAERF